MMGLKSMRTFQEPPLFGGPSYTRPTLLGEVGLAKLVPPRFMVPMHTKNRMKTLPESQPKLSRCIATSLLVLLTMFAVKAGARPGLKATGEFKHLTDGLSLEGNSFAFFSRRFGEALMQIQSRIFSVAARQSGDAPVALFEKLSALSGNPVHSFTLSRHSADGWFSVGRGNQQPANAVVLPLFVAAGGHHRGHGPARPRQSQVQGSIHFLREQPETTGSGGQDLCERS